MCRVRNAISSSLLDAAGAATHTHTTPQRHDSNQRHHQGPSRCLRRGDRRCVAMCTHPCARASAFSSPTFCRMCAVPTHTRTRVHTIQHTRRCARRNHTKQVRTNTRPRACSRTRLAFRQPLRQLLPFSCRSPCWRACSSSHPPTPTQTRTHTQANIPPSQPYKPIDTYLRRRRRRRWRACRCRSACGSRRSRSRSTPRSQRSRSRRRKGLPPPPACWTRCCPPLYQCVCV